MAVSLAACFSGVKLDSERNVDVVKPGLHPYLNKFTL
jgi:hypothetical protein